MDSLAGLGGLVGVFGGTTSGVGFFELCWVKPDGEALPVLHDPAMGGGDFFVQVFCAEGVGYLFVHEQGGGGQCLRRIAPLVDQSFAVPDRMTIQA